MPACNKCGSGQSARGGVVAGKQRRRCRVCGCHFREGDGRTDAGVAAKKALCVLLHATAKASFRALGRALGVDHTLVHRWVREFGESLPGPEAPGGIMEMEFDEMWHFVESKKQALGHQGA